jgi:hypothetical protein
MQEHSLADSETNHVIDVFTETERGECRKEMDCSVSSSADWLGKPMFEVERDLLNE